MWRLCVKYQVKDLIRAKSPAAVAAEMVASSRRAIFHRVEYHRNSAGDQHQHAREGSFALAYPLSRQSGPGKGYRAGKSDTPLGIVDLDFRFIANGREKIPTIRACVAGGGWRRGISTGFNCVRVLFLLRG
jgi:hypothetical protein